MNSYAEKDNPLLTRFHNYGAEECAIIRKIANGVPQSKKERLVCRLLDIKERLAPNLIKELQGMQI